MKKLSPWARGVRYAQRSLPHTYEKDRPLTGGEVFGLLVNAYRTGFVNGRTAARAARKSLSAPEVDRG